MTNTCFYGVFGVRIFRVILTQSGVQRESLEMGLLPMTFLWVLIRSLQVEKISKISLDVDVLAIIQSTPIIWHILDVLSVQGYSFDLFQTSIDTRKSKHIISFWELWKAFFWGWPQLRDPYKYFWVEQICFIYSFIYWSTLKILVDIIMRPQGGLANTIGQWVRLGEVV